MKGQMVKELKAIGIRRHPHDNKKLELHKTSEVAKLYKRYITDKK